uniref:DNA-directed RNA polymerase subunit beta' n=1 Tax=Bolboschoenus planiculmis TaxID=651555 RepID=A0A8K1IXD6_9POAL|nr:RNA polymerase beta' subunit [Bolboschoenus planiculmis]UCL27944.1 RNA polymerase beta' subunit [Bolboschoenus planiculmis]ULQ64179.1 RNA polymerase beta' subunit [Bolboschoenus planiculmis]
MIDQYKHQKLQIGPVSPQQIKAWATKILPNGEKIVGEVTKNETFHYKSNKPERNGLFCERIFGPIKSGFCACGKYQEIGAEKENPKFCQQCGVEFGNSRIRRYQMGYIKLACAVTHVWYLKGRPSYIANLLDKSLKELKSLVYCGCSFARPTAKKPTFLRLRGSFEDEIQSRKYSIPLFFNTRGFEKFRNREIVTGADAIREQLADLDLRILIENSLVEWKGLAVLKPTGDKWEDRKIQIRKNFLVRRMELAKRFLQTNIEPEWMVLYLLPVLPPELRPIIQIEGGKLISSDINELYKRVIEKNIVLSNLLSISSFLSSDRDVVVINSQAKLLQEAVDILLHIGVRGQLRSDGFTKDKDYKSFSDILGGKEGRFRETLLGRRVDYSGRSVIVVGPSLSLYQCGLPREMAIELFQAFLIRHLIRKHFASNIATAKRLIQEREKEPIVWETLKEVMEGHPILLNRAPTLHRLGILAFQPILVEERAIYLHPLVCKGFNADFDGDQMAVHLPLSLEAQAEARLLMFSHINLLSPAIGDPICVPTQDMLIGLYVLTMGNRGGICANRYNLPNCRNYQNQPVDNKNYKYNKEKEPYFSSSYEALGAYRQKRISLNSPLWLRWNLDKGVVGSSEIPIEVQYESLGTSHEIYGHYLIIRSTKDEIRCIYIRTTLGHISFYREIEEAIQGFSEIRV